MNKANVDTDDDNGNEWYCYEGGVILNEQNDDICLKEYNDLTVGRLVEEEISIQSYHLGKAIMINNEGDKTLMKENDIELTMDDMKNELYFRKKINCTPITSLYDYYLKNNLGSTKAKSFIQGLTMGMGMGNTTGRLEVKSDLKSRRSCNDVIKGEVSEFNIDDSIRKDYAYSNRKEITSIALIKRNRDSGIKRKIDMNINSNSKSRSKSKGKSKNKSKTRKREVITQRIIIRKDTVEVEENSKVNNNKTPLQSRKYHKQKIVNHNNNNTNNHNDNKKLRKILNDTYNSSRKRKQYHIAYIDTNSKSYFKKTNNEISHIQAHTSMENILTNINTKANTSIRPLYKPTTPFNYNNNNTQRYNNSISKGKINHKIIQLHKQRDTSQQTINNQYSNEKTITEYTNQNHISLIIQPKSFLNSRESSLNQLMKNDYVARAHLIKSSNGKEDIRNRNKIKHKELSTSKTSKNKINKEICTYLPSNTNGNSNSNTNTHINSARIISMTSKQFLYGNNHQQHKKPRKYTKDQLDSYSSSLLQDSNKSKKTTKKISLEVL